MHGLDLFGPVQVFYEACELGFPVTIDFAAYNGETPSAQGIKLSGMHALDKVNATAYDLVVVPGLDFRFIQSADFSKIIHPYSQWLRSAKDQLTIASICSGVFLLAEANLLHQKECTTHWKCLDYLRNRYTSITVLDNRLFVNADNLYTSAGMASGIDMSLYMLEEWFGPIAAAKVAREMVIYLRRDGKQAQQSIYLDFRTHLNEGIHRVQDHLMYNPEHKNTLDELSDIANMSARNLTRVFRQATGISIQEYKTRLRIELAENLMRNPSYTIATIAEKCGFENERQLRRIWKSNFGLSPSQQRTYAN